MTINDPREAMTRALAARGFRAIKSEDWDQQAVLSALRENRRRHANSEYTQAIGRAAEAIAAEIADLVDVPPADIAMVLLAAGGSIGMLALMQPVSAKTAAEILQFAADELDQRARAGEPS
ncbi:hypothetical protein [Streptomyces canus]|uniref:hypothetical protein n=1 Tax=Streptomyces canus TaxID=58343 RepID=UPI003CE98634